jgi:hypothetical protein
LRLVGFNAHVVPSVDGVVTCVSADSLLDRPSNARYYLTRITLNLASKGLSKISHAEVDRGE